MAKQVSVIRLSGTLGGITFYQQGGKDLARMKSSLSREAVLEGDNFERTRENANEFRHGVGFMKWVRKSLGGVFLGNKNYVGRMNALIYRLLDTDSTHIRGQRLCSYADLTGLSGFRFLIGGNIEAVSNACFFDVNDHANSAKYTWQIVGLDCAAVSMPVGATHFRVLGAFGQVHKDYIVQEPIIRYEAFETPYLDNASGIYTQDWNIEVKAINIEPYRSFMGLRLEFYQALAGVYYPLAAGQSCALVWAK